MKMTMIRNVTGNAKRQILSIRKANLFFSEATRKVVERDSMSARKTRMVDPVMNLSRIVK